MKKGFLAKLGNALALNKRQKFVLLVLFLSSGLFISQFFQGRELLIGGIVLGLLTDLLLFLILRRDIKGTFYYPLLILPFFYSFSFVLFYSLVPERILTRVLITAFYSFGLYSLLLTQNIFAVSTIRTISLLRSARIVSFVITIIILFFLINISYSLRFSFYLMPLGVFIVSFLMAFQSLWISTLEKVSLKEVLIFSIMISLALMQLSLVLIIWPVTAAIYSLFLTGIFYTYTGLSHVWFERRLFKGVLWEYIWVGFFSVIFLIVFSEWGI